MEQLIRSIVFTVFTLGAASAIACNYPGDPDFAFPNGAEATKDEMVNTQGNVKSYVKSVEGYLACLDEKQSSAGDELTEEQRAIHSLRYNAAVDSMELVADQFNVALRAFKDAQ